MPGTSFTDQIASMARAQTNMLRQWSSPTEGAAFTHQSPPHPRVMAVTHGETGYFGPAETQTVVRTWNSLVPRWVEALSVPDSVCSVCTCVSMCKSSCFLVSGKQSSISTPTPNHSSVLVSHILFFFFSPPYITCGCFQDTYVSLIDRKERVINRKGGRN